MYIYLYLCVFNTPRTRHIFHIDIKPLDMVISMSVNFNVLQPKYEWMPLLMGEGEGVHG